MTALDQAFIRAFSQQGTLPVVPPRQSAADLPDACNSEDGTVSVAAAAPKSVPQPSAVPSAPDVAPPHISDVFRDVLATLERPPVRPKNADKSPARAADIPWNSAAEADTGAWMADWCQTSLGMAEPLSLAEPIALAESVGLIDAVDDTEPLGLAESVEKRQPPRPTESTRATDSVRARDLTATAVETPRQSVQQKHEEQRAGLENRQSTIGNQQSPVETLPSPAARLSSFPEVPPPKEAIAPPEFKPAWQVERFTWPRVCRRLMARAAEEFDRLADALLAANARGQKVLAMTGCCRGEGTTTLLLCAARRLAERGVKLVLVDADLNRPRLAKRLGVEVQSGWNETSGEDATFLSNAVVESAANNLALAAIREPADDQKHADWSWLAGCLDTLKNHYEMVLVDLGPLESIQSVGEFLDRTVGGKIDAILLVRNPRITSEARLAAEQEHLNGSGVALAGLIENFVAE
jgi:Mrp family chromosome partitioning ATPase